MIYIHKIDERKQGHCHNCTAWDVLNKYVYNENPNHFSIDNQFEKKEFFCSDECAENKIGGKVI